MKMISIVIPVYYNEQNLPITYHKLKHNVLSAIKTDYEIIFVDDGSKDNSYNELLKLRESDKKVKIIKLSKNFGQHIAIYAGLKNIKGDCAIVISADLQDPPELILQMLDKYSNNYKVVIAVREDRQDGLFQKMFSYIFYCLIRRYAIKDMPKNGFDCFLADKQVIDVLTKVETKNLSLFNQIIWLGFNRAEVHYTRLNRDIGKSGWSFSKKIKLAIDSLLAFSFTPIRVISLLGIIVCISSFIYAIYVIIQKIFLGAYTGWSSLMVAISLLSGIQMLMLGIIGEYLWRNFDETLKRPLYIIDEKHGIE